MTSLLLRPFAYLTIKHPSARLPFLNFGLPLLTATAMVALGALLAPSVNLFHPGGLVDRLLGFIQNLPGFYLAALAAIATFGRPGLDALMPGTPARVRVPYNQQMIEIDLTRRRFVSMMFSYLTALSFALTLTAVIALSLLQPMHELFSAVAASWLRALAIFVYLAFCAQMVIITLWGLYYLGERINAPD